jgi:hypothetical protein
MILGLLVILAIYVIIPSAIRASLVLNSSSTSVLFKKLQFGNVTDEALDFQGELLTLGGSIFGTVIMKDIKWALMTSGKEVMYVTVGDMQIPLGQQTVVGISGSFKVNDMVSAADSFVSSANYISRTSASVKIFGLNYDGIFVEVPAPGQSFSIPTPLRAVNLNSEIRKTYGSNSDLVGLGNTLPDVFFKNLTLEKLSAEELIFNAVILTENPMALEIDLQSINFILGQKDPMIRVQILNNAGDGFSIKYPDPSGTVSRIQELSIKVKMEILGTGDFISKFSKLALTIDKMNLLGPLGVVPKGGGKLIQSLTEKISFKLPTTKSSIEQLSLIFIKKFGLGLLGIPN